MTEHQKIKETLSVIRKALEDDNSGKKYSNEEEDDNILILNQKINEDGTVVTVNDRALKRDEVVEILNQKLDKTFENYLNSWLDKNIPKYIEKYFKNKKI